MSRFIEGQDRSQVTLLPECLDDFIADDNPVRVVDAFIGELDMVALGFEGVELTPFHGHLIVPTEGVRDAQSQTAVPGAIS